VKKMPQQFEKKEIKGKSCIYIGTEWHEVKATAKKEKAVNEKAINDIRGIIKIGETEFKITARPRFYENSKRNGYYIWLDRGQDFLGNGNLYMS
jgi:hypothetical protein